MQGLLALDRELFYLVNHGWATPFLDWLFPFVTQLRNFVPLIVVLVIWLAWRGGRRGRICLLGLALAVGITDPLVVRVVKPVVSRDRPCIALEDTRLLASRKASPSFPSAHAANMFAVATVFGWCYRRSLFLVLPFAALVSISRIYIGVHYPLDAIGGAALGTGVGLLVVGLLLAAGRRIRWLAHVGPSVAVMLLAVCGSAGSQAPEPSFTERIVDAAIERTSHRVRYDGSYRRIPYPWGDVPDSVGVCTDLVVRGFRAAGVDLQRLVHEDMTAAFDAYPALWGLDAPDPSIDHRRVPNLATFFTRSGYALEISREPGAYLPGDVVRWMLPGELPHIGIVVDRPTTGGGAPLVVHNIGRGPVLEDVLFAYPITGHYRFPEGAFARDEDAPVR